MSLLGLVKAIQIAAAVSSIVLARRRAEHWPAAIALVVLTVVAVARGPLGEALASPVDGSARVALVYADGAAELATYATVGGLAVAVAVRQRHRRRALAGAVVVWALASIALGAAYPSPLVRGPGLQRIYLYADLAGLFVASCALAAWAMHAVGERRSPKIRDIVALSLVALDGAILLAPFSPWRGEVFGADFAGIQVIISVFFAAFAVAQVLAWSSSRG